MSHYCIISPHLPPTPCGVGDHTYAIARELALQGHSITIITEMDQKLDPAIDRIQNIPLGHSWRLCSIFRIAWILRRDKPDILLLQWVPYLYSRWGINLMLPIAFWMFGVLGIRTQVVLHELWIDAHSNKHKLIRWIQQKSIQFLVSRSERVLISTQAWIEVVAQLSPKAQAKLSHWPMSSTIPRAQNRSEIRIRKRTELGISRENLVLAVFSPSGSGKSLTEMAQALSKILEGERVTLLVIGRLNEEAHRAFAGLANKTNCKILGYQSAVEVTALLAASDIMISYFADGLSTRRSSALAALCSGLVLVSNRGRLTDEIWHSSPVQWVDAKDLPRFVQAFENDLKRLAQLQIQSMKFFDQNLSLAVLVKQLVACSYQSGKLL